ncbi:hypothetical protein ACSSS7_007859 [Eimeria intestinalis]
MVCGFRDSVLRVQGLGFADRGVASLLVKPNAAPSSSDVSFRTFSKVLIPQQQREQQGAAAAGTQKRSSSSGNAEEEPQQEWLIEAAAAAAAAV